MPHQNSGPDAQAASAANPVSPGDVGPAEAEAAGDRVGARREPVFGVKAARGQRPYAILGRSGHRSADAATASGRGGAESAPASAHSMRVSGGQVVDVDADTDKASATDSASAVDSGKGAREVKLPPMAEGLALEQKPAEAMRLAQEAFSQTGYWVTFYRAILGVEGVIFKLFPSREEMDFFQESAEFAEIHTMLTALRTSDVEKIDAVEPQAMITIRMPRSLQAMLVEEAGGLEVSINKLCISKLLLPINPQFVPPERGKVRGRKPGQQSRSNRAKTRQGAKASKG